jgi:monoamine oxidase
MKSMWWTLLHYTAKQSLAAAFRPPPPGYTFLSSEALSSRMRAIERRGSSTRVMEAAAASSLSSPSTAANDDDDPAVQSPPPPLYQPPPPPPLPKVIIVGAGFAGLAVAYRLRDIADCRIVEARDRIGGRVHSVALPSSSDDDDDAPKTIVELGGQWIHEARPTNPIIRLLQDELKIPLLDYASSTAADKKNDAVVAATADKNSDAVVVVEKKPQPGGKPAKLKKQPKQPKRRRFQQLVCDGNTGQRIPTAIYIAASKFMYRLMQRLSSSPQNGKLDVPFQHDLDEALKDMREIRRNMATMTKTSTSNDGDDEKAKSYNQLLGGVDPDDPLFRAVLNSMVHNIECHEGGRFTELSAFLDNHYEKMGGPDEIPVGGYGAVATAIADRVGRDRISLNLPVETIDSTGAGDDTKREAGAAVQITCRDGSVLSADYCVCTVPLGVLQHRAIRFVPDLSPARWQAIDAMGNGLLDKVILQFDTAFWNKKQPYGGNAGYDRIDGIGVAHEDISRVQQFYDCTEDFNAKSPILVMFMGGDAARRIDNPTSDDVLTDEEITAEAMRSLRLIFGDDVPDPTNVLVTRWLSDPYSYGSYSFTKIGCTQKTYQLVAEPVYGRLFFAGEHTSLMNHACVHGAWSTGERSAQQLMRFIEREEKRRRPLTGGISAAKLVAQFKPGGTTNYVRRGSVRAQSTGTGQDR